MEIMQQREELRAFYAAVEGSGEIRFPADPGNLGFVHGWAAASFDDSGWPTMQLPGAWTAQGLDFSGVLWFRKAIDLPPGWAGHELSLSLGAIDKTDITYFNGVQVGATGTGCDLGAYDLARRYTIPGCLVQAGRNLVAVRAYSFAYAGGLTGPAEAMALALPAGPGVSLAGPWRHAVEHNLGRTRTTPATPIFDLLNQRDREQPGLGVYPLKALQYAAVAEGFEPKLFLNSPFYFEAGINGGWEQGRNPGRWLLVRNLHLFRDANPADYDLFTERQRQRYYLCCGPYVDLSHNCPSFSNVLRHGLGGIYAQAERALAQCLTAEETAFVQCALQGLLAAKRVAERFAEAAERLLAGALEAPQRRSLERIAATAREVPWRRPETFYEGLNTLWFLREVGGLLDGLATNTLGRPDAMLIELYRRDLEAGRLTPDEAYELVCQFLLPGDCHYDKDRQVSGYGGTAGHELEITLTLGGCDEHGEEVFNELTRMFLRAYHELALIYPKPHCRFGKASSPEYLGLINADIAAGRSVYSLLNDDCIIPALLQDGKRLEDARRYLCTGCWDIVVESCEDLATGNYFNLARILEMSIHDAPEEMASAQLSLEKLDGAGSFEEVYGRLLRNVLKVAREMCLMKGRHGTVWPAVNPAPFASACMADCLSRRRDFTAGGGRYNPHALPMVFFANYVDSLLAIRRLCFDPGRHSLGELLAAVRANWQGHEPLRAEVLAAPHFGDDTPESNALARRLHEDLYAHTRDLINERGGGFQLAYWVYREFRFWGELTRATPDGRRAGEYLAQSLNPSRLHRIDQVTSTINSVAALDLTKCAADSVVNIVLPAGAGNPVLLDQFERACAASNLQLLQLNCVSREALLDACLHPERHQDLVVRVCGFSAKFVALPHEWQQEFITRNFYDTTTCPQG